MYVRAVARRHRPAALTSITAALADCGIVHEVAQVTGAIATGGRLTRGPVADTRQHLKQLWHVLVRYGEAH